MAQVRWRAGRPATVVRGRQRVGSTHNCISAPEVMNIVARLSKATQTDSVKSVPAGRDRPAVPREPVTGTRLSTSDAARDGHCSVDRLSQVCLEPVGSNVGDLLELARALEEVACAFDDVQFGFASERVGSVAIQVEHLHVVAADDE